MYTTCCIRSPNALQTEQFLWLLYANSAASQLSLFKTWRQSSGLLLPSSITFCSGLGNAIKFTSKWIKLAFALLDRMGRFASAEACNRTLRESADASGGREVFDGHPGRAPHQRPSRRPEPCIRLPQAARPSRLFRAWRRLSKTSTTVGGTVRASSRIGQGREDSRRDFGRSG